MKREIFKSEEEIYNFIDDCVLIAPGEFFESIIKCAKEKGYMKKSIIDEAEEMYNEKKQFQRLTFCEVKLFDAIQYLKNNSGEKQ